MSFLSHLKIDVDTNSELRADVAQQQHLLTLAAILQQQP
jgi:hypothetical protein